MAPAALCGYFACLSGRLAAILEGDLLGVYAAGSVALGAYEHGPSDVDVVAISRGALTRERKRAIVTELRHESLACPARGLELVVYTEETVGRPSAEPGFELELNTGSRMPFDSAFDPSEANGTHWYVIDRAILARHGVTLVGPAPSALVADVPRELVLPALVESVRWFARSEAAGADAVLNACRALRYVDECRWSSKLEAGRWAIEQLDDRELIADALKARETGEPLPAARVREFLSGTVGRLEPLFFA